MSASIAISQIIEAGEFRLHIANDRTKTPEEWAEEIADKVVFIGDTAPPGIREQAHEFRERIRFVVAANLAAAVREERAACAGLAEIHGSVETAQAIRSR